MARIAVEGLKEDIVPVICKILEVGKHQVCYRNESPSNGADIGKIKDMISSNPELSIICNARGYLEFLDHYKSSTDIPFLVLTGGGPDLVDKVAEYTPHVLHVPFGSIKDVYKKVDEILVKNGD
jgi:hypothetical protein